MTQDRSRRDSRSSESSASPGTSTRAGAGPAIQFRMPKTTSQLATYLQMRRAPARAPSAGDTDGVTEGAASVAAEGVAGSGQALPHGDAIQRSFGRHDVGGVTAHVGGAADEAAQALGAQAYATGDQVAFRSAPDLHLAAHEAAHVVQQRAGVQLKGGVGEAGDAYERHADQVADRVVSGQSAEGLLDEMAGGSGGAPGAAVQCKGDFFRIPMFLNASNQEQENTFVATQSSDGRVELLAALTSRPSRLKELLKALEPQEAQIVLYSFTLEHGDILLLHMHTSQIAELLAGMGTREWVQFLFKNLTFDQKILVFPQLRPWQRPHVLHDLPESMYATLLTRLSDESVKALLADMTPAFAQNVICEVPPYVQDRIAPLLPLCRPDLVEWMSEYRKGPAHREVTHDSTPVDMHTSNDDVGGSGKQMTIEEFDQATLGQRKAAFPRQSRQNQIAFLLRETHHRPALLAAERDPAARASVLCGFLQQDGDPNLVEGMSLEDLAEVLWSPSGEATAGRILKRMDATKLTVVGTFLSPRQVARVLVEHSDSKVAWIALHGLPTIERALALLTPEEVLELYRKIDLKDHFRSKLPPHMQQQMKAIFDNYFTTPQAPAGSAASGEDAAT